MSVRHDNYMPSGFAQRREGSPVAILTLAPGQKMPDLIFRLRKLAVISGRVLDEDGDPIRDVDVSAVRRSLHGAQAKNDDFGGSRTNDLGEYRLYDMPPGRYFLVATPVVSYSGSPSAGTLKIYQPIYYSGASDISRATAIDLKSGDDISGIDFTLALSTPPRTYNVRGHVADTAGDIHNEFAFVVLIPRKTRAEIASDDFKTDQVDRKSGEFAISGVSPGEYTVMAILAGGGHRATQNVTVTANDVDDVSLSFGRGVDLPARVAFDGKSAARAASFSLLLEPREEGSRFDFRSTAAETQPDGSYLFRGVDDGIYTVRAESRCEDCFLKSASVNGVDVFEHGLEVSSGAVSGRLDVVYSSNSGSLSGTVTTKDDLPAAGVLVVLVPDPGSHLKPVEYSSVNTDQYGHFEVRGIPPGHYRAYAFEKPDVELYGDSEALKPYESMGESLDVAANDRKTVRLKMIPAPDANP
jgi:hypothetical protein